MGLERGAQPEELVVAQAGAGAAHVDQLAVSIAADVQGAEAGARALRLGEADDGEVGRVLDPDLHPLGAAARLVRRGGALADHALEAELLDLRVERLAVLVDVVGEPQRAQAGHDLREQLLALR